MPERIFQINDSTIRSMAGDTRFTQVLPFLRQLSPDKQKKCGGCRNKRRGPDPEETKLQSARRSLAVLPAGKQAQLKELLGAEKVRVIYLDPGGRVRRKVF